MDISIELKKLSTGYADNTVIIVPYFEETLKRKDPSLWKGLETTLKHENGDGKKGNQTRITHQNNVFVFVGLGSEKDFTVSKLQNECAQAIREQRTQDRLLTIDTSALLSVSTVDAILYELTLISHLANFEFTKYLSNSKEPKKKRIVILLKNPSKEDTQIMYNAERLAEGIIYTRSIINEPANVATPSFMVSEIKKAAKTMKWKVDIFDAKKMTKMGLNLIVAVGQGSSEPSYFTHIAYRGAPKKKEVYALVGKGVCFDTGGVQTKDGFSMNSMKHDKGGAVTVLGVLRTLSKLRAKINVDLYIPFVKNSVDGAAYQPDDIFTAYNKKTVEIRHTDAEGRLILADALAYACERNPTEIHDFATLTGAATIALGSEFGAILGTNETAMKELMKIGKTINDQVWQLPMHDTYREYLKSGVADIANVPFMPRQPGTITGGMFLKEFVKPEIPWIHFDIAAVIEKDKAYGIYSTYATGRIVRLMTEYLLSKQ